MRKKYELSNITMVNDQWITLYRIRALKDFETWTHHLVKAGDFGGWVENENNLSQEGNCWVADDAQVFGGAIVCDDALVYDLATVGDHAQIHGNALISGKAHIYGGAVVSEASVIREMVNVCGDAQIYGNSNLSGNSYIFGAAKVHGWASLSGDIAVYGLGEIHGNAILRGRMNIGHLADIPSTEHVISIGPIGSRHDTTTFYRSSDNDIWVGCGCFNGNISKFEKTVKAIHGDNKFGKEYMHAIQFARDYFGLNSSKWSPSKVCRIIRSWKRGWKRRNRIFPVL